MPSCLVNQCISKTGRKGQNGQVILHSFPKDLDRIKIWLLQTGQVFKDLNGLAEKILNRNQSNQYRMCSCHFTLDSYIINLCGRTLRVDAVPSIFPIVNEGETIIEENLKKDRARKRKIPFDPVVMPIGPIIVNQTVKAEPEKEEEEEEEEEETFREIEQKKTGFCSVGTQTDHTLSNSIVVFEDLML